VALTVRGEIRKNHQAVERREQTGIFEKGRLVLALVTVLFCGIALLGCATTAQVKALEEKTQQALDTAEEALKEAQKATALEQKAEHAEDAAIKASREAQAATARVEDSAQYKDEAAASAQRAEDAALRAEKAAAAAEDFARKASEAAKKCEDIFQKIMAK
jgi:hypothetical protein